MPGDLQTKKPVFLRTAALAVLLIVAVLFTYRLYYGAAVVLSETGKKREADLLPDRSLLTVEKVVSGLSNPWGMVFLPDGRILVTEIEGSIKVIKNGVLLDKDIQGVPVVYRQGQGGLLDIALHPQYDQNHRLYISYARPGPGGGNTAIASAVLEDYTLTNLKILYAAQPNTDRGQHFGSRLAFDNQNRLLFSIGDRGERDVNPQDLSRDGGKIYRIHDDGSIPESNPFTARPNAIPAIYSYGHRNPQGLARNPVTGAIWEHEHGPRGGDELNIIQSGKNFGWPIISYGINYDGSKLTDLTEKEGMEQPLTFWTPSIAPCGMTFIEGDKYPGWKGDLIVGSLKFNHLVRLDIEGDSILRQEILAPDIGRVRNVKQSPDGYLYVAVEGDGLYRLLPGEQFQ